MTDFTRYRDTDKERERSQDLLRLIPRDRRSVLDIGALDGHFSRILTEYFQEVTALDLEKPPFEIPGVTTVAGDVTQLQFPDKSFDCVFCAEVIEHVPQVEKACAEIARVTRHEIILGVPYRQDIRIGRTTCSACGKINPPWGHVNSFDERRLAGLFPGFRIATRSFVGHNRHHTNALAAWLMDVGGNPWGKYHRSEPCMYCRGRMEAPANRTLLQKISSATAFRMTQIQTLLTTPHANWIHLVLRRA